MTQFEIGRFQVSLSDHSKVGEIKAGFHDRAREPDTLFLLSSGDSLAFLDELKRAGVGLAGVEGFRAFPEDGAQPVLNFSNDIAEFTGSEDEFFHATKRLIAQGGERGLYFQVVTQSSC